MAGAGLAARSVEVTDDDRGELLYSLIIEASDSRVLHEVDGEDLVLRREAASGNNGTAVQFKYSRHGTGETITPSELRDILRAFDRCAKAAVAEFPVTANVLVTNRDLNDTAWRHHRLQATPFDDLSRAERAWLNVPEGQRDEITEEFGSVEAAARAWYGVFQRLSVYPRVGLDYWLRTLRDYASERGLYDHEFDPALSMLVGDALRNTLAGPAEFSRAWLNRCLLGFSGARSLRFSASVDDSARDAAAVQVRDWLTTWVGTPERALMRREHLKVLGDKLARHPIVLVLGGGGCGKSTLAAQFLLESTSGRFVAAIPARDLHALWLGRAFNAWRDSEWGLGRAPHPVGDVPNRIRHANPHAPRPILVVDVDGLDERADRNLEDIRALVTLCRDLWDGSGSDMSMILTSRATSPSAGRARRELIADLFTAEYPGDVAEVSASS